MPIEQLSSIQGAANAVPTLFWLVLLMGFLAALVVGMGAGMFLLFLREMGSALPRFNRQTEETLAAFQELRESLLTQTRATEVWHRRRKEQREEQERDEQRAPEYTQDWRNGGQG